MTNPAKTVKPAKNTVPMCEKNRFAQGSMRWFLEEPLDDEWSPKFSANTVDYFICGEEAFADIATQIKTAKKSIDIVCWGFDPAMELTRSSTQWPRGETWGGLLLDAAQGRWTNGQPVQVRIVSWFGFIANVIGDPNMPGYVYSGNQRLTTKSRTALDGLLQGRSAQWPEIDGLTPAYKRQKANELWYTLIRSGEVPSLQLRIRDGSEKAIEKALKDAGMNKTLTWTERQGMEEVGTYHQKTVLIDYDDTSATAQPLAYVMGLNSVTDYWDTRQHLFNNPKRGCGWEGAARDAEEANLKPLQDYATRIEGEALVMVSKNFTDAWNQGQPTGLKPTAPVSRQHDPKKAPAHLTRNLGRARANVQIVRTEPKASESNIHRLYLQALRSARNYIYVENQYFQYAPWVQELKKQRETFMQALAENKVPKALWGAQRLHLFVITPTPERKQMVPRTHDAIKELGHGNSMPKQSEKLEAEIKDHQRRQEAYDKAQKQYLQTPPPMRMGMSPPPPPAPLSELGQSYKDSGGGRDDQKIQEELRKSLGLRSLVASLWSFDADHRARQRKALAQLETKTQLQHQLASTTTGHASSDAAYQKLAHTQAKQVEALTQKLHADRYREIYIHSKLMLADDSMFTIGSANMNARSFFGDGEINMVTDCPETSTRLRHEVWGMHSHGFKSCAAGPAKVKATEVATSFEDWQQLLENNMGNKDKGLPLIGHLVPLEDKRTSSVRLG
jgi:phosphatidylserine/phosphatidylglycerophosphate/cardiolipin synthase-like enzyme